MKIIKLMGGLGNQMFQYAFGKWLNEPVLFDPFWYENEIKFKNLDFLKVDINNFNVNLQFASKEQIKECLQESGIARNINKIGRRLQIKILPSNRVYEKVINHYQPSLKTNKETVYYEGYYQSIKYFDDKKEELINDFTPKNQLSEENARILDNIASSNSVAISVRHANDYQQLGWALDEKFYIQAMQIIAERTENPHFYIFSDDIEWCKTFLKDTKFNITFANSNDENCGYACGIYLMSQCKHNIIANSTYSWWGAYLNNNPGKTVIMPKKWLPETKMPKTIYKELFLNEWIMI